MRLVKKGEAPKADDHQAIAAIPAYPWDAAMAMLATGEYDVFGDPRGERGPDQPGEQSPAPGTDPVGGKEEQSANSPLTNLTDVGVVGSNAVGLPTSPEAPKENVVKAPSVAAPANQPVPAPVKAEAPTRK